MSFSIVLTDSVFLVSVSVIFYFSVTVTVNLNNAVTTPIPKCLVFKG